MHGIAFSYLQLGWVWNLLLQLLKALWTKVVVTTVFGKIL